MADRGVSFYKETNLDGDKNTRGDDNVSGRVPRTQPPEPQGGPDGAVKFYKECVPGDYTKTGPSDAGHRAFGTEKRAFVDELTHNQRGRGVTSPDLEGNVGDAHQGSSE